MSTLQQLTQNPSAFLTAFPLWTEVPITLRISFMGLLSWDMYYNHLCSLVLFQNPSSYRGAPCCRHKLNWFMLTEHEVTSSGGWGGPAGAHLAVSMGWMGAMCSLEAYRKPSCLRAQENDKSRAWQGKWDVLDRGGDWWWDRGWSGGDRA